MPEAMTTDYWNSRVRAGWVLEQERLDRLFAPLALATLEHAAPTAGEHVLDVGCGCGATVIDLARKVGPSGRVIGVDIAADPLKRARERVSEEGVDSQVTLTLADAGIYPFKAQSIDLIFSRLGVMFFSDPVAAFVNLRGALKSSGRLAFVCPRALAENRYVSIGLAAARSVLPVDVMPVPQAAGAGMFSFADPDRVRTILHTAGFRQIRYLQHDQPMRLGGPGESAEAALFSTQFGPLPRILANVSTDLQKAILAAVSESYRRLESPQGVVLDGAFWIVTAQA